MSHQISRFQVLNQLFDVSGRIRLASCTSATRRINSDALGTANRVTTASATVQPSRISMVL